MKSIEDLISSMSLEEKVGQLLVVGFDGVELDAALKGFISDGKFSGFILFKRNIESVEGVKKLIKQLRALYPRGLPPILATDEEGGRVSQVGHLLPMAPPAAAIGETRNTRFAFFQARDTGQKLRWLGFNVVFAPVLDINDEPENPIIGDRAYGIEPDIVTALGVATLKGLADTGIAATAKHFPGHGSTKIDSHKGLPVVAHSVERWYTFELVPFSAAMEAGVRLIMTGHIACPGLTGRQDLPATFSSHVIEQILRKELRYTGVVITDAMEMGAVEEYVARGGRVEEALEAGCDLLLFAFGGEPALRARDTLLKAIRNRELSEDRIDESLKRILKLRSVLV